MSDALTDIRRDEQRDEAYTSYIETVLAYLKKECSRRAVKAAAAACDSISRGYWASPTVLEKEVNELLFGLDNGDQKTWARLLVDVKGDWETRLYRELRKLSPWPDKKMAGVSGDEQESGLGELLRSYLKQAGFACAYHGNPEGYFIYAVFYDENSTLLDIAKSAVWIGTKRTRWSADRSIPYIVPASCTLEYLAERAKLFRKDGVK